MNAKDYKLISSSALFAGLSQQECGRLLEFLRASENEYKAGELLHVPGAELKRFGFVLSGLVQVYRAGEDSRILMESAAPGGSFCAALCFSGVKNPPVEVAAAEDSRVLWLSPGPVKDGRGTGPSDSAFSSEFVHCAAVRTAEFFAAQVLSMNSRIQVLTQKSLRKKIMTLLMQHSEGAGKAFSLPFSREEMAVHLGCDRSALSRELAAMKKDGIIDYYKNSFKVVEYEQ